MAAANTGVIIGEVLKWLSWCTLTDTIVLHQCEDHLNRFFCLRKTFTQYCTYIEVCLQHISKGTIAQTHAVNGKKTKHNVTKLCKFIRKYIIWSLCIQCMLYALISQLWAPPLDSPVMCFTRELSPLGSLVYRHLACFKIHPSMCYFWRWWTACGDEVLQCLMAASMKEPQ